MAESGYQQAIKEISPNVVKELEKQIQGQSFRLKAKDLEEYNKVEIERKVRPASDFTESVLEYFLEGGKIAGMKLPFAALDSTFRLRKEEVTVLAGINGSGKSLLASQWLLGAMQQGYSCLSVSMEMSPKSQCARMWRQGSLDVEPTLYYGLDFGRWSNGKLWFYDQQGNVDLPTLNAVMKWAKDNCDVDLILVDSLMTLNISCDDYNGQKKCINTLANVAREMGVHIILVCHARKGVSVKDRLDRWSIRGASEIADRADNIFLLGRTFDNEPMNPDAYLTLAKARHFDGAECDLDLWLDMASMNYHLANEPLQALEMDDA
jgi:twinkle protein